MGDIDRVGELRKHRVTLITGDGIGPEVIGAAKGCVDAVARKHDFHIVWDEMPAGEKAQREFGSSLPEETLESIRKNKVALKGPVTTPIGNGFRSVNAELRRRLDLFANLRPMRLFPGVNSRYQRVDLVVIRENTEDFYPGIEFNRGTREARELIAFVKSKTHDRIRCDSAISLRQLSYHASKRIMEFAFEYAKNGGRKKITVVHKANILKFTDGLFLRAGQSIAKKFGPIQFEDRIIDNMCMQLVVKPELYDVIVCPNLYGDILSDLCAGLVGGLGITPGANIGPAYAVFEPAHGSALKYTGKDMANPTAAILSTAMMLDHIGQHRAAKELELAVLDVIKEGKTLTFDLKPADPAKTSEMTEEIINKIGKNVAGST